MNAYFVFTLVPALAAGGAAEPWRGALGVVFVGGALFVGLTALGARERLMDALSPSLKSAIAAGIGLFIAFVGLQNATLIDAHPATLVQLRSGLLSPDVAVFALGLGTAATLAARGVAGAVLFGIAAATAGAIAGKGLVAAFPDLAALDAIADSTFATDFELATAIFAAPPSLAPTFFTFEFSDLLRPEILPFVAVFLFTDLFDTIGTLVGVSQQAGLLQDGRLPRAGRALAADAAGSVVGACLGTSTVTSYVESAAGVAYGGRTGLVAVVVAALFLASLFFAPLVAMVASYPPLTAPALVLVGALMLGNVRHIEWDDLTEALPAFLIVAGIPLLFSIGDGLALGLLAYPLLKLAAGRRHELRALHFVLAAALGAYLVLVR